MLDQRSQWKGVDVGPWIDVLQLKWLFHCFLRVFFVWSKPGNGSVIKPLASANGLVQRQEIGQLGDRVEFFEEVRRLAQESAGG